jgi:hypothetical protein
MIHYTSKGYPVGQYGSIIEDIDDVSSTLFNQKASPLPRAAKSDSKASSARLKKIISSAQDLEFYSLLNLENFLDSTSKKF